MFNTVLSLSEFATVIIPFKAFASSQYQAVAPLFCTPFRDISEGKDEISPSSKNCGPFMNHNKEAQGNFTCRWGGSSTGHGHSMSFVDM